MDVAVGAKHKGKAAEKEEQRQASLAAIALSQPATTPADATKASPAKEPAGKKTPKDPSKKKEKTVTADAQGNELKKPLSAYMLYNNHRRPTLRAEHPGKCHRRLTSAELALPDLSKLIGEEWKKLSEPQRHVSFRGQVLLLIAA